MSDSVGALPSFARNESIDAGIVIRNDATKLRSSTGYRRRRYGFFLEWDSDGDGYVDSRETAGEPVYPGWCASRRTVGSPGMADAQDVAPFVTAANTEERSRSTFDGFEVDSAAS